MVPQHPTPFRRRTALLALALLGAALSLKVIAQDILIGRSLPLSGPLAPYGIAKMQGADLMLERQNASGGVSGRKLRVITLDDEYEPAKAVANARSLAADSNVLFMLSSLGVASVSQLMPVLEELKLPGVGFSSGVPAVREPAKRYVFPMRAGYREEAEFTVRQLMSINISRVALVQQDDSFGKAIGDAYRAALTKNGFVVPEALIVKRDDPRMAPTVAQLIATAPQAVLMAATATPSAALLKEYRKRGGGAFVYAMSATDASQLAKLAGEDSRGVGFSQIVPLPSSMAKRISREYATLAAAKGIDRSFYGLEGYIEASIAIEGIRRSGKSVTRERLVQALSSLNRYDLGDFEVTYGQDVRQGSRYVEMIIIGPQGRLMN